jgi:CMP-N-acetylneuraminic acid synthetase
MELATDEATTLSVLQHVIEKIPCDSIVLLQATSPIRRGGLIDECIREFIDNEYDSLATGFTCKYVEYGKNNLRRQDIEGFFCDDGNIYVIKADLIRGGDRYGKKIGKKIISRWENVEIDDDFDFWVAEHILEKKRLINGNL